MYTLDKEGIMNGCMKNRELLRVLRTYLLFTAAAALFGAVYEYFGRGVWSAYMVYAFAAPLLLGVFPALHFLTRKGPEWSITPLTRFLWGAGVAALTVGSIFKGVLDIFGTTNRLILVYPLLGAFMLAAAALTEAAIKNGLVETDQA